MLTIAEQGAIPDGNAFAGAGFRPSPQPVDAKNRGVWQIQGERGSVAVSVRIATMPE